MHNELYGHLLAALRFGAGRDGCRAAVCIAFDPLLEPSSGGDMSKCPLLCQLCSMHCMYVIAAAMQTVLL